ncbi:hypothetical protein ILUMI_19632, partial [Ignelater luminosus]
DSKAGPCQQDEGGPLVGTIGSDKRHYLIGIAASGVSCNNTVSLYTNVTFYRTWISSLLNKDSDPNNWYR